MTLRTLVFAALLGGVLGASAALVAFTLLENVEALQWRCIEYSPVNGKCVVLERVDRPRLEEDRS